MRGAMRGASAVESLLVLPVVLLLLLGALQLVLLAHARLALSHALLEAARAASVAHASPEAARDGLARGLVPFLGGSRDEADHAAAMLRARVDVALGEGLGWMRLRQLSPTTASFDDWGVSPRGPGGAPRTGPPEIPTEDLDALSSRARPRSGSAGEVEGMPVGRASGQTLADAGLLRLQLDYGVPLRVPLAGRLLGLTVALLKGCPVLDAPTLGALQIDAPAGGAPTLDCRLHGLPRLGDAPLRLPMRVVETIRMQSPPRLHSGVPERGTP